jgi:uncharacterized protein (TIGR00369 family)
MSKPAAGFGPTLLSTLPAPDSEVQTDPRLFPAVMGMSGLEQLRHGIAGKSTPPPVDRLIGLRLDTADPGAATSSIPASDWLEWQDGVAPEGVATIPADSAHALAVYTTVGPGMAFLTVEFSLSFCAAIQTDGGRLKIDGRVLHSEDSSVLSEVVIRREAGHLVAHGTSLSWVFPLLDPAPLPPKDPYALDDARVGLEPHTISTRGTGFSSAEFSGITGLQMLERYTSGLFADLPIYHFLGIRPVSVDADMYGFSLTSDPWLCSSIGSIQGGVIAFLAERAAWAAVTRSLPRGASCRTKDIKVNYFRRLPPDGQQITAVGEVGWRGRNFAAVSVRVWVGADRLVASAVATIRVAE